MENQELLILGMGICPHKNDGILRFEQFCKVLDLPYMLVGEGGVWTGGDMAAGQGGGQKINELVRALDKIKENKLIVVCDTFDLFPIAGAHEIINKFNMLCTPDKIIFSSEIYCWPDKSLEALYPPATDSKYKFLCSGTFMGYRDTLYNLVKDVSVNNEDDDQLFYTKKFLDSSNILLDNKCELFQALNGVHDDVIFYRNRIYNKYTKSYPVFLHGNGGAKSFLNQIENYVDPNPNTQYYGCVKIDHHQKSDYKVTPKVFMAAYIDSSKFSDFDLFLGHLVDINYSNRQVYIYDSNQSEIVENLVQAGNFIYKPYTSAYTYDDFLESDCEYYFLLEQKCIITNKNIINELLPLCGRKRVFAPLLKGKDKTHFTNFWGDIDQNEYYKRSNDYFSLIEYEKRGFWNAPYVGGAIFIRRDVIENFDLCAPNRFSNTDIDMALCHNLRKYTIFMYMTNLNNYGYLNIE